MANRATSTKAKQSGSVAAMTAENNQSVNALEKKRFSLVEKYKAEKKYKVKGAPAYQAHFGSVMSIIINGVLVTVPLDGRSYEIPESFAQVFNSRIRQIDNMALQQSALADVANNIESMPGEKDLITPV